MQKQKEKKNLKMKPMGEEKEYHQKPIPRRVSSIKVFMKYPNSLKAINFREWFQFLQKKDQKMYISATFKRA